MALIETLAAPLATVRWQAIPSQDSLPISCPLSELRREGCQELPLRRPVGDGEDYLRKGSGKAPPPRRHIGQLAIQLVGLHGIGRISGWDDQGPEKGKIAKRTHFAVRAERIVLRNEPNFARVREFSPKPVSAGAGASCRPPPRGPGARKWPSPPPQWIPVSGPRRSSQRSPTSAAWPPSNCLIRSAAIPPPAIPWWSCNRRPAVSTNSAAISSISITPSSAIPPTATGATTNSLPGTSPTSARCWPRPRCNCATLRPETRY